MAKYVIGGQYFNPNFFKSYMTNIFGESFAHSSLSFEKEFNELNEYEAQIEEFSSIQNLAYYIKLLKTDPTKAQAQIDFVIEGMITMYQGLSGIKLSEEAKTQMRETLCTRYSAAIKACIRPFMNRAQYEAAREQGTLTGAAYEEEFMISRVRQLLDLIQNKKVKEEEVSRLKAGNNEAFRYALSEGSELSIPLIKRINALVNSDEGIHEGFKTVNNEIKGCNFETCPKEEVPVRMQYLLHQYTTEWSSNIPVLLPRTSYKTEEEWDKAKDDYIMALCLREAKLHVEFERIHPFEDGNGRTGRIILNKNLVANGLAPIIITPEMRRLYIGFINNRNYEGFARFIYMQSSVTLSNMIAELRKARRINPDSISLSKEQDEVPATTRLKK